MQTPTTQHPLWKTYLLFLTPMVLSNFLQSMSGTVNSIYIGQMLGTQALAAVSGMFPIVFFFITLVIGLGAGASVLIGQAWGAREPHLVKTIAATTLLLGAIIGLAAMVLGRVFARPALQGLGTPADVLDDAVSYAHVKEKSGSDHHYSKCGLTLFSHNCIEWKSVEDLDETQTGFSCNNDAAGLYG